MHGEREPVVDYPEWSLIDPENSDSENDEEERLDESEMWYNAINALNNALEEGARQIKNVIINREEIPDEEKYVNSLVDELNGRIPEEMADMGVHDTEPKEEMYVALLEYYYEMRNFYQNQ